MCRLPLFLPLSTPPMRRGWGFAGIRGECGEFLRVSFRQKADGCLVSVTTFKLAKPPPRFAEHAIGANLARVGRTASTLRSPHPPPRRGASAPGDNANTAGPPWQTTLSGHFCATCPRPAFCREADLHCCRAVWTRLRASIGLFYSSSPFVSWQPHSLSILFTCCTLADRSHTAHPKMATNILNARHAAGAQDSDKSVSAAHDHEVEQDDVLLASTAMDVLRLRKLGVQQETKAWTCL